MTVAPSATLQRRCHPHDVTMERRMSQQRLNLGEANGNPPQPEEAGSVGVPKRFSGSRGLQRGMGCALLRRVEWGPQFGVTLCDAAARRLYNTVPFPLPQSSGSLSFFPA